MPDRQGFNHLGGEVRCIDCDSGGPRWQWPEHKRVRHAHKHRRLVRSPIHFRRQRDLLAASPNHTHEEKEATSMAKQTKGKPESAKLVAIDALRQAGKPLKSSEVAKRVIASGRCAGLKGKTPEATISAMLAIGSKPGGPFTRVEKGTYTLTEAAPAPDEAPPASQANKRPPRKPTKTPDT